MYGGYKTEMRIVVFRPRRSGRTSYRNMQNRNMMQNHVSVYKSAHPVSSIWSPQIALTMTTLLPESHSKEKNTRFDILFCFRDILSINSTTQVIVAPNLSEINVLTQPLFCNFPFTHEV